MRGALPHDCSGSLANVLLILLLILTPCCEIWYNINSSVTICTSEQVEKSAATIAMIAMIVAARYGTLTVL